MKEFVCIVCPRGCHLSVDDKLNVTGNFCPRGKAYAQAELTHPIRTITSTMRISNREDCVVPVKTVPEVPKEKIFEVMDAINSITLKAPVKIGDIAIKNVLGLGSDIVICQNID